MEVVPIADLLKSYQPTERAKLKFLTPQDKLKSLFA